MSDNIKTYTLSTRINYLRSFAQRNAQGVTQFEAALMRNLLEMTDADKNKLGSTTQTYLIAGIDRLKKASNDLSSILNELAREMRNDDLPL
jgi:hypothetical protein